MSAPLLAAELPPGDACPVCPPGIPDASPPLGPVEFVNGGRVTDHECGSCGTAWSAFWRDGWAIDRLIAPVSPDQAERNRAVLAEALKRTAA